MHNAAGGGYEAVVRLLVERGARLDWKDVLWGATPADWAAHEGKAEVEAYLREQEAKNSLLKEPGSLRSSGDGKVEDADSQRVEKQ